MVAETPSKAFADCKWYILGTTYECVTVQVSLSTHCPIKDFRLSENSVV